MSNYHKFKVGDKVETKYGSHGEVREVGKDATGKPVYTVKTQYGETNYKEDELSFNSKDLKESKSFDPTKNNGKCPVCSTSWTKTGFGSKTWYDCLKCGKKAEDIVNRTTFGLVEDYSDRNGKLVFNTDNKSIYKVMDGQLTEVENMYDEDDDFLDFFD